jgi:hypothetical protein
MDYTCEYIKMLASKEAKNSCDLIGLDSLFQKTLIITSKERTVQPGDSCEDTALKPGYEIVEL